MNPLDEIEMEMGGKLKVGMTGHCTAPHNVRCNYKGPSDETCRHCTLWKPVEPERVKGCLRWFDCDTCNKHCRPDQCQYYRPPGLLQRMGMCTYPEPLFICSKAGECRDKWCTGSTPHQHQDDAASYGCYDGGHCIPYVPEDEAREWFVIREGDQNELWMGRLGLTKAEAALIARTPGYRAFKWSDGLKGGE